MAAETYHVSSTATPSVTPPFDSGWEVTTSMVRMVGAIAKTNSAMVTSTTLDDGTTAHDKGIIMVIIATPNAGTLSGTFLAQFRAREGTAGSDSRSQTIVKTWQADGTTVIGTAYAMDTAALSQELDTVSTNHQWPRGGAQAFAAVNTVAGGWITFEFGTRRHATTSAQNMTMIYGDLNSLGDLPADETTTTSLVPTIILSAGLPPAGGYKSRLVVMAV